LAIIRHASGQGGAEHMPHSHSQSGCGRHDAPV
jgi:hypothetical protein